MNLGTARIVVIVALVVAGFALLANGFGDGAATVAAPAGGAVVSPTGSPVGGTSSPTSTESPAPTLPSPQAPADVTIAVFNGTTTTGLAAQGQQTLTDAGYVAGQPPADAPATPVAKTTIYYRTGKDAAQNQSDAQAVADGFFKGAKVAPLGSDFGTDILDKSVIVAVVLGQNYANKVGG